ncbi:hypothetical protein QM716_21445 [Rhodococcus sp. IEGM 1409]|uniref:hypothetical protein n=1 Tax=Rhodococcus sp. IEGM 1409 TaxID=3047082 RepID=UPI0024B6EFDF|nr:hypothetical protein [Rhodococcus sp. IEGM 1409]MDI9902424.1 hypothetical protein [Rhodococcus sp. IEGM 1409]
MTFDDVADELYGLDPGEFVEARTNHVKAAREDNDRALAAEIGKLRKPTTVGWLVNLISRDLPEDLDALLALGESLRDAQRHLSGPDLRRLTTQRQQVVRSLAYKSGEIAASRGKSVGEDSLRDVAQTLNAALADEETAAQVRLGRVVTAASYSGFGPAGLAVVKEKSPQHAPAEEPQTPESKTPDLKAERAGVKAELKEARAGVEKIRRRVKAETAQFEDARSKLSDLDRRIEELRADLEHAEQERQFAKNTEKAAGVAVRESEEKLREAERRVDEAEEGLD